MADFRRWILAFAALVLIIGSAVPASAQINCTASASVTPTLRHEGFTELTGDILLTCQAANPQALPTPVGQPVPTANIAVSLSAPVTSRVLSGNITEALLLIDDPPAADQKVCAAPDNPTVACEVLGDGGMPFNGGSKYNVFQGVELSTGGPGTYSITFLGVPVDPPVTTTTYRITNVRIDATSVPAGSQGGLSPVFAFVSASSSTSVNITNPQNYVGFVSNGLTVGTTVAPSNFLQCLTYGQTPVGTVTFTEDFATAFKTRGVSGSGSTQTYPQNTPGFVYNTESGLEVSTSYGETGWADTATELQTVISNIPSGVTIYAQSYAVSSASTGTGTLGFSDATMVAPVAATSASGIVPVNTTTTNGATTTNSSATIIWAITDTNSSAIDSLAFTIYASFSGVPGTPGTPAANQPVGAVSGFSPEQASATNPMTGPIPEFSSSVNVGTTPTTLFSVALCQTILLFPYVTDFYGFDTGIAISNTSLDNTPTPAAPQPGACSVTFYGSGGVATTLGTSGTYGSTADSTLSGGIIAPGQTWAFSMSGIDPNYNSAPTYGTTGYAIATCNFQYAHGYSFVSDTGIRNFAAAYLALIIPDAPRSPNPFLCASYPGSCLGETGEQLVH